MQQLEKDESILRFLADLSAAVDPVLWRVVDHWDGDLLAVGVGLVSDPRILVYVSVQNQEHGRYYYVCEAAPPMGSAVPYQTVAEGDGVTFDELVRVIRDHFAAMPIGAPRS